MIGITDPGAYVFVGDRNSLKLKVYEIEDPLGLFYLAVWKILSRRAVGKLTLLYQELFGSGISTDDFSVVYELNVQRAGVLLRVSSLALMREILSNSAFFKLRWLSVKFLVLFCVSGIAGRCTYSFERSMNDEKKIF